MSGHGAETVQTGTKETPGGVVRPMEPAASRMEGIQMVARSSIVTAVAALLELFELAVVGTIVDFEVAVFFERSPYIDHGFSLLALVIALGAVQYLLMGVEMVARHRSPHRGWTLPLAFLPLGRGVRTLLMLGVCTIVLLPKLTFYFVTLTAGLPVLWLLSRLGVPKTARLIDGFDNLFEPVEKATNHLYNALFYNKIEIRGSTFTALFNLPLTLWCLNH